MLATVIVISFSQRFSAIRIHGKKMNGVEFVVAHCGDSFAAINQRAYGRQGTCILGPPVDEVAKKKVFGVLVQDVSSHWVCDAIQDLRASYQVCRLGGVYLERYQSIVLGRLFC